MSTQVSLERLNRCYEEASRLLLNERCATGHWVGELSASALSTATAVMALHLVHRQTEAELTPDQPNAATLSHVAFEQLISSGLRWLAKHQNADGGWGDTIKSRSNISTTMLAHATLHAADAGGTYRETVGRVEKYLAHAGGVAALSQRYGKDRTFSIPILTHCALAGLVNWNDVASLPFELACVPHRFYKTVRMPVVSYALPALIAIGQVRHFHGSPRNPFVRLIRRCATGPSLKVLERIQPPNGGFLEATPLTSFVTMSLASMGLLQHPVLIKGIDFLVRSVREDGSWPIDTNLATWLTTLSVNALGAEIPETDRLVLRDWLLQQQYDRVHPYTNAAPGGWAWTDLPGGVPDADDTAGAILALLSLRSRNANSQKEATAVANGVRWLLNLQNADRGWPTFCRGWGALPFDRSASDISAHALRALTAWLANPVSETAAVRLRRRALKSVHTGFRFLEQSQRPDGSWVPLWFGNQDAPDEENPTYGTARVLAAFRDAGRLSSSVAQRGIDWLTKAQNADGGWGGTAGVESTIEETALATESLLENTRSREAALRGLDWLLDRVESGSLHESAPIGFYFAKLWYFERLYPLAFTVCTLSRACRAWAV